MKSNIALVVDKETEEVLVDEGSSRDITYSRYQALGGIINQGAYESALARAKAGVSLNKASIAQAELISRVAGFSLSNTEDEFDEITTLYGVLRSDSMPGERYHHGSMCDQRIMAEVLRMLDQPDLLAKILEAFPNIVFV